LNEIKIGILGEYLISGLSVVCSVITRSGKQ